MPPRPGWLGGIALALAAAWCTRPLAAETCPRVRSSLLPATLLSRMLPPAPPEIPPIGVADSDGSEFGPIGVRFFDADEGRPIPVALHLSAPSPITLESGQRIWEAALAAWNGHAAVELRRGTITTGLDSSIPPETLARVGFFPGPAEFGCEYYQPLGGGISGGMGDIKVFGGRTWLPAGSRFAQILITQELPGTCPHLDDECEIARVASHEVGHMLGLGHILGVAVMGGEPDDPSCFCGGPTPLDIAELETVYPRDRPPTITTPSPLPHATISQPYALRFDAIGGTGPFTWTTDLTGEQPSHPFSSSFTLSPDGMLTGTPSAARTQTVLVRATDANGDSHTKSFTFVVDYTPLPTTTTTSTTLPPLVGGIPCTTTTTTMPRTCGNVVPPCARRQCQATTLLNTGNERPRAPRRLRALVRRLELLVRRATDAMDAGHTGRLRRSTMRIDAALTQLSRTVAEPRVTTSLGEARSAQLRLFVEQLLADHAACVAASSVS